MNYKDFLKENGSEETGLYYQDREITISEFIDMIKQVIKEELKADVQGVYSQADLVEKE